MTGLIKRLCCGALLCAALLAAVFALPAQAENIGGPAGAVWREEPRLAELFKAAGLNGSFVLYDREKNTLLGCNAERAGVRYLPASTFKILNSLIAFETGVVKDASEVMSYGGGAQPVKAWEKDMNLKDAMAVSNVPLYQGIARRIGRARMAEYVRKAAYGNAQIGDKVDDFWLKGPLAISILEQIRFINNLNLGELPFSARSQGLLREIMPREAEGKAGATIFYKTGLASAATPPVGWVAGWLELDGKSYPFALNFDITRDDAPPLRLEIMRKALAVLGLY